ncbi:hypothetical protein X975_22619, partial [Stegodyphus mimosarum]
MSHTGLLEEKRAPYSSYHYDLIKENIKQIAAEERTCYNLHMISPTCG